MAQGAISKWQNFGQMLVALAGPNLEKLQAGIAAGIAAETARSGTGQPAAAKKGRGRARKQTAAASAT